MTPCIIWDGYTDKRNGYGVVSVKGRLTKAHRAAWVKTFGPIPNGLFVLHRCDVRNCVNPEHLFIGTQTDNMRDCRDKGRNKYPDNAGEKHGLSKLTDEAVRRIQMLDGLYSQKAVARMFGVTQERVSSIMTGRAWKHVGRGARKPAKKSQAGAGNSHAKITEQTAVRIKMLAGVLSPSKLGDVLGISSVQVRNIMTGKSWSHVTASTRYTF